MINFRTLRVWELSHEITLAIYQLTQNFPKEEIYGLTSQMRRSAASIPTNIAEGCGRGSDRELLRFLYIGMGSASELEYLLFLAKELNYISEDDYSSRDEKVLQLKKMLNSFITKIKGRLK